jgi:hypothetical protein
MLNLTAHDLKTKGIAAIEAVLSNQVKSLNWRAQSDAQRKNIC